MFKQPFAVFMKNGSIHLLWAASQVDYNLWTNSFLKLKENNQMENLAYEAAKQFPTPVLNTSNYFVATIYMCLIPSNEFAVEDE